MPERINFASGLVEVNYFNHHVTAGKHYSPHIHFPGLEPIVVLALKVTGMWMHIENIYEMK